MTFSCGYCVKQAEMYRTCRWDLAEVDSTQDGRGTTFSSSNTDPMSRGGSLGNPLNSEDWLMNLHLRQNKLAEHGGKKLENAKVTTNYITWKKWIVRWVSEKWYLEKKFRSVIKEWWKKEIEREKWQYLEKKRKVTKKLYNIKRVNLKYKRES